MSNHVHLIVTPNKASNLGKAIGEIHRRYTRMINFREGWRGYLWQGRFSSFPMDENWLLRAAAYVELNPVKAGMVEMPWDYQWSSVHAHLSGEDALGIVDVDKMLDLVGNWKEYLLEAQGYSGDALEKHEPEFWGHDT